MRKSNLTTKVSARALRSGVAVLAVGCLLAACSIDEKGPAPSGPVPLQFHVTDDGGWTSSKAGSAASAQKQYYTIKSSDNGAPMYLHARVSDNTSDIFAAETPVTTQPLTRAQHDDGFPNSFGVYGYLYSGTEDDMYYDALPNFMCNIEASKSGDYYTTADQYYLPGDGDRNLLFFAYSPYNPAETALMIPPVNRAGAPYYTYSTPRYANQHFDLCFSKGTEAKEDGVVPLQFTHALTCIRILADATMKEGSIIGVKLNNVQTLGVYEAGFGTNYPSKWQPYQVAGRGTVDLQAQPLNLTLDGKEKDVTAGGAFFMLPQNFQEGNNASIEITFKDPAGASQVQTFSLTGQTWEEGKVVTYRISKREEDIILEIKPKNGTSVGFNGATLNFEITSRKGETPVEYSMQFSTDGGQTWVENTAAARPAMIGQTSKNGTGGVWSHSIPVNKGLERTTGPQATDLGKTWLKDEGLIKTESANCYMVSSPGTYRFLAVYGNAYLSTASDKMNPDIRGQGYFDGAGTPITTPYLPDNITAELVWQDVPGLVKVTGITGSGTEKRINITVGGSEQDTRVMQPGNALIAAKNASGVTLWTWHIWVTPNPGEGEVGGKTFLRWPVGFVMGGQTTPDGPRSCLVRVYAKDPEDQSQIHYSDHLTITQTTDGHQSRKVPGRYPTYQWGRMTPLWPSSSDYANRAGSPMYNQNGTELQGGITTGSYSYAYQQIANPRVFNTNSQAMQLKNLWNAAVGQTYGDNTTQGFKKSIYDPCPVGYHVPEHNAFSSGFVRASGGFEHTLSGAIHGSRDLQDQFGITTSNVFLPYGGYRSTPNFNFTNQAGSFYYGGSWTAGYTTSGYNSTSTYVLCYIQDMGTTMIIFIPRVGMAQATTKYSIYANPLNCWPITPQKN